MKFKLILIFLCFVGTKSVPIEIENEQEEGMEPIEENLPPQGTTYNNNYNGNLTIEERLVNVERRIAIQDQKINQVDDQMMYIVGVLYHQLNWSKFNQNNQQNNHQSNNNQTPNQRNPNNTGNQNNASPNNYNNQNVQQPNNYPGNQSNQNGLRNQNRQNNQNGQQQNNSQGNQSNQNGQKPNSYQGNQSNQNGQQPNSYQGNQNGQQPNSYQGNQSNQNGQQPNNYHENQSNQNRQSNQNAGQGGSPIPNNQPSNSHHSNSNGGNRNSYSRTGQGEQTHLNPQTQNENPWNGNINNNAHDINNRRWHPNGGQFNNHGLQDPNHPFRTWLQNNNHNNAGSTNQQPQNANSPNSNTGSIYPQWRQQGPVNPTQQRRGYFGGRLFSFEQNSMETLSSMLFNRPMGGTSFGAESFEDLGNGRSGMMFPNRNQNFFGNRALGNPQTNNHHQHHNNSPTNTMNPVGNPGQSSVPNSVPTQSTTTPSPNRGQGQTTSSSLPTQSTNQPGPSNVNENAENNGQTVIDNSKPTKIEPRTSDRIIPNNTPVEPKNINEDYNNIITDDGFTGKKKGGKQKPFSPISTVAQTGQVQPKNQNGEQNTNNGKGFSKGNREHEVEHEETFDKEAREEFGQEEGEAGEGGFEREFEREGSEVETQQAMMLSNLGESPYDHPPLLLIPSHVEDDND